MNESDILGYNSYAPIVIHPEQIEQGFRKAIEQGNLEGWEGLDLSDLQLDWDRIAARACENLMSDPCVDQYVAEAIEDSLQDEIDKAVGREDAQSFPER